MPSQSPPVPAVYDLYAPVIDSDPFPIYTWLRDNAPAHWSERDKHWILSRYDDVSQAVQDWETFSSTSGNLVDEIPGRAGATLGSTDPPRHDRLRALAQAAFMKKNIEHLEGPILELADRALDRLVSKGRFDFVAEYSSEITISILLKLMGLPAQNPAEIRRKVILSISTDKSVRGRNQEQIEGFSSLAQFLDTEVNRRRAAPSDDLITRLAEAEIDGERLSDREIVMTSATFVMAGIESLSSFMTMVALNLHDHEDARARIVADPRLMLPAIEESLRFNTSAQRFKRTAARDSERHGKTIRKGDTVILAYGSANRDERKFANPDTYDIDRKPVGHMGFGGGKHFCMGSQMARFVTDVAMRRFLARIPEFRLTTPRSELAWISSSNFRSPVALPFEIA
jgi:cytochrome P450